MTTHTDDDFDATLPSVAFFIPGTPAPQGSKRYVGGGRMVESSRRVIPWRAAVKAAAQENIHICGPVNIELDFYLARPKGHYRTGKYTKVLRDNAPTFPISRTRDGDIDKIIRSTLDGLVAGGVIDDDALVVTVHARKRYADFMPTGAEVFITAANHQKDQPCPRRPQPSSPTTVWNG